MGLGVYLIVLPLPGFAVSANAELIGGNYTNVTSDIGACIAAGGTLHLVSENRKRRRIGVVLQLSFFTCHAETRFKIRVSRMEPGCDALSDIRIVDGFGYRGPDHEAAAGASFTREING